MRLGALVFVGLAAGCAATQAPEPYQPWNLEDGTWGHDDTLVADAGETRPARTDGTSDAGVALASQSEWRGAGDDRPVERRDDVPPEKGVYAWLHKDRATAAYEERLVGGNDQPEWTTHRRFTTTQLYVLAPGQIVVEQRWVAQTPKGEDPRHAFQTSVGFGFDGGFEADLYENWGQLPNDDHTGAKHVGVAGELRYALGKWGEIPLNPTLLGAFVQNHRAPDFAELKVLLATDFGGGGWHWAADFGILRETELRHGRDLMATMGISKTICDSKWSIGAEAKFDSVSVAHHRSDFENQLLVGPSLQWRPTPNTHLDIVPLFGLVKNERRDPRMELQVVFGIDFGPEPTSRRQREETARN